MRIWSTNPAGEVAPDQHRYGGDSGYVPYDVVLSGVDFVFFEPQIGKVENVGCDPHRDQPIWIIDVHQL